jgi:hypothetical protein
MGRACSTNGGKRNAYRVLVGKSEGKRPLGRTRRRWVGNIEIDLREIGLDGMDWLIWIRVGTSGGLLWTRWWNFWFHKMLGSYWIAAQLAASQEGLSSVSKYTVQTSNTPCPHTSCKVHWWWWNFRKCIILGKLYQPIIETVRNISFFSTIWNRTVK